MVWSYVELRDDVRAVRGDSQANDLTLSCTSLNYRWFYVRFHLEEAVAAIAKILPQDAPTAEAFAAVLGGLDKGGQVFEQHRLIASAHTVACLQSLHAVTDTLAHIVCLGLGLNLAQQNPLMLHKADARNVAKRLSGNPLSLLFERFTEHSEHKYLSAVVNQSKHRSIVDTGYHVDLSGTAQQAHGLQILAFRRGKVQYAERWLRPFVAAESLRQANLMIDIGAELNRQVRAARLAKGS